MQKTGSENGSVFRLAPNGCSYRMLLTRPSFHYSVDISALLIRLGEYDTFDDADSPHEDFQARRIVINKNYHGYFAHDIAVVQLDRPVKFNIHIKPICLPESGLSAEDQKALVSGWGRTSNMVHFEGKLRQIGVQVASNAVCATGFKTTVSPYISPETVLCAGSDFGATCGGDSGGPLTLKRNGRAVLIGLAAGGPPDCELGTGYWGFYTNVSSHLQWIRENTDRNLELSATPQGLHWA